jgi:[acyl-carrier-protein] S-malonyltransferase
MAWASAQGVTEVYEIGAGKALSGMIRRIDRELACTAVNDPDGVKAAAEKIG